jgi:transcriptional regulator with XRE-family HTH domain
MGLTQLEMAGKLGVSEITVWKLENGKRMKPSTVARFEVFETRHKQVTRGKVGE